MRHAMNITASDENAIARLLRAGSAEVRDYAATLSESRRAHLALFCHARAHYRDLGLLLAKECSPSTLKVVGGYAGQFLAEQAACILPAADVMPLHRRQSVSLARGGGTAQQVGSTA